MRRRWSSAGRGRWRSSTSATGGSPGTHWPRAWLRAVVEPRFAWLRNMGYRRARYRRLTRHALDFGLLAAGYHLKRSFRLLAA